MSPENDFWFSLSILIVQIGGLESVFNKSCTQRNGGKGLMRIKVLDPLRHCLILFSDTCGQAWGNLPALRPGPLVLQLLAAARPSRHHTNKPRGPERGGFAQGYQRRCWG